MVSPGWCGTDLGNFLNGPSYPACGNVDGGSLIFDNGAGGTYCYNQPDNNQVRAQKACESHFGEGNCCIIMGGYNSQQYGQCGQGGGGGTIHWHYDNHPANNCAPNYVIGDVVSPGWCGNIIGRFLPKCANPGSGDQVHDNGAKESVNYCYFANDSVTTRAQKACESHFGTGNCCVIVGGYNSLQWGQCGMGGGNGTIHWHPDSHPNGNCAPNYIIGDVVSPGWCGVVLGNFVN